MAYQQPQDDQRAFDLAPINNTLPAFSYQPQHSAQYPQGHDQQFNSTTSPPMALHMGIIPSYGDPTMQMPNHSYYVQQQPLPQYYPGDHISQAQNSSPIQGHQSMVYYPNHMMANSAQTNLYYTHNGQFSGHPPATPTNMVSGVYMVGTSKSESHSPPHLANGNVSTERQQGQGRPSGRRKTFGNLQLTRRKPDGAPQSTVRGPPRKPRQSGHALWIGNLPPQTNLMGLVHHVCKKTPGLESLFLISKSNCAFANFKDEHGCSEAQQNLHDSKFQSVRLVTRLRRNTVEGSTGSTAPTGPAASSTTSTTHEGTDDESVVHSSETSAEAGEVGTVANLASQVSRHDKQVRQHEDKFFILKSLTTEDLALSGADNVYLIFSANKSGEYFGYARMVSQINEDPAAAIEFAPKVASFSPVDVPKAIPTDATEYAPKGKIIDDSARGTIFWEVERDDSEVESDRESESASDNANGTEDETKIWGKPFKLEWLSTSRLPFFRTRGLRNPWNSNREVKIARDGTELEPSVGRRLIGLFNRVQNPTMGAAPVRVPNDFLPGYSMMRPY
ncbi:YTH domain protein [Metarhizium rileyi]|uniref:YTH domain protein n=1 Tax=Metarhizium rileyi (strain RCEF 4871) TaxID=1649241 RepID=A0A167IT23_METRR|nr:YTH domain protein [Metarhizium rileyi RCEF 4871]